MWLPKNERILLRFYYGSTGKPEAILLFPGNIEPMKALGCKNCSEIEQNFKKDRYSVRNVPFFNRVWDATQNLHHRGLIKIEGGEDINPRLILTFSGCELSRKYNAWWTRSGLWFAEYKNHWIWVIVGFLVGVIGGGVLVNWLSKGFK